MWKIQNVNKNQNELASFKVSASKNQMLEDEKYQREAFQTLLLRQDDRATEIQVKLSKKLSFKLSFNLM